VEQKIDNKNTTLSKSPMLPEKLKFFKLNEQAQLPTFATKESACFDFHANLVKVMKYSIIKQSLLNQYLDE